ncbi:MAG TPA: DUF2851 family protein [Chitinophagaceae bacterium]|nr:DUF2851 family protein [Chitinophagaceae bacterium]
MTERLLQYIWQMQFFNKAGLVTTNNEPLQIIFPGNYNNNQGPDFLETKIKIGNTILVGNAELHIKSSDWKNHKHSPDRHYKNVIIHVVWDDDVPVKNLPTLVLQNRVSKLLFDKYRDLMENKDFIPCQNRIAGIDGLLWQSWKERLLIERLQRKSEEIFIHLTKTNNHWEEVLWWMIAGNFGGKVNKECFEDIAKSISINILAKHKKNIQQLEALLLGQAGILNDDFEEAYPKLLYREYEFCKSKYNLREIKIPVSSLRMRPSSFPAVRLAQLAMLIHCSLHLFSKIKESNSLKETRKLLDVTANDYWHYHYVIGELSSYKPKHVGAQMVDNIFINTIIPVLFAYGQYHNEQLYKDRAVRWMEEIKAEENLITKKWSEMDVANKTAFDSQSLIELRNRYCLKRKCLDCVIGHTLLKKTTS